jgi:hypothetical protein
MVGKLEFGDIIEVPKEFIQLLKDVYNISDKKAVYFVRKYDYVEELLNRKDYLTKYKNLTVREFPFQS